MNTEYNPPIGPPNCPIGEPGTVGPPGEGEMIQGSINGIPSSILDKGLISYIVEKILKKDDDFIE